MNVKDLVLPSPITFWGRFKFRLFGIIPSGYVLVKCCENPILVPTIYLIDSMIPSRFIATYSWREYRFDGANQYLARNGRFCNLSHISDGVEKAHRDMKLIIKAKQLWSE